MQLDRQYRDDNGNFFFKKGKKNKKEKSKVFLKIQSITHEQNFIFSLKIDFVKTICCFGLLSSYS